MNELKSYNSAKQLDALLTQMEDMERELTHKDRELNTLRQQLQEKDRRIQTISSDNQKLSLQIKSANSVLSEQEQLLQQQTEQLEKYSGSDIIFQENSRLKSEMAECQQREKEIREKALMIYAKAEKMEKDADGKLAQAKWLQTEYQRTLARELSQKRCEIEKEIQREGTRYLQRKSRQMSGMTIVLLLCYLAQMLFMLFTEKEITSTIPTWFRERGANILWLIKCIGDFYGDMYRKLIADIPIQCAIGVLVAASIVLSGVLFYLSRLGFRYLKEQWKYRWQYYDARDLEEVKQCAALGMVCMGFSFAMLMVKMSLLPFHWNVVSWWIFFSGCMEVLYFHYDEHGI